ARLSDDPKQHEPIARASEATEKRALVVEPEFARVLAVAAREGSTLSSIIREAWDSETLEVLTRKDPLRAEGVHVSIMAHCTIEEPRDRATTTDAANGFLNRFLFACVRRPHLLPAGGELPVTVVLPLAERVSHALARARGLAVVKRTPAAEERWDAI